MENQSPAGSAKLNYVALDLAVFGVRVQSGTSSMAKLLRTHPPRGYPGEKRVCKVHSILTTLISFFFCLFSSLKHPASFITTESRVQRQVHGKRYESKIKRS